MADVSVDIETGIVKMNKMVAVQDCGLVINLKTAESQVYGALIMGISYALYRRAHHGPDDRPDAQRRTWSSTSSPASATSASSSST